MPAPSPPSPRRPSPLSLPPSWSSGGAAALVRRRYWRLAVALAAVCGGGLGCGSRGDKPAASPEPGAGEAASPGAATVAETGPGQLEIRRSSRDLPLDGLLLRAFVDERDHGTLPLTIPDLAPGEHALRVVDFRQRYAPFATTCAVGAGETVEVRPDLVVLRGQVEVTLGPGAEGASVELVTGEERRRLARLPAVIDVAPQEDDASTLVAKRKGAEDFVYPIDFSDGVAQKKVVVEFPSR